MSRLTQHAIYRYATRTGNLSPSAERDLEEELDNAMYVTASKAIELGFSFPKVVGGDKYLVWYSEKYELDLLAIEAKDKKIKTVLSKAVFSMSRNSKGYDRVALRCHLAKERTGGLYEHVLLGVHSRWS